MMSDNPLSNLTVTLVECLRCHFTWLPRVQQPARCPKCGSRVWNEPK